MRVTNHLTDNTVLAVTVAEEDFYQQLKRVSNTTISLSYTPKEFLTFRASSVSKGRIVRVGTKAVGLECQINGKTYRFNQEHLDTMSHRERNELFESLGIDKSQFSNRLQ